MSAARRIGLFVAGMAVAFGAAFAAGSVLDPDRADDGAPTHDALASAGDGDRHGAPTASGPARIVVEDRSFAPGEREALVFRVVDRRGRTIRDFDVEHERAMHVIAVRHDLTGYRHLHPRQRGDGAWTVDVAFSEAGPQRVFADFVSRGASHTLFADVDVAGHYAPRALPAPSASADAGDGYAVAVAGDGADRRFTVAKDGVPVEDIEPYLGARGHLVALSEGDLAFQHVHPRDPATRGREIGFDVELDAPGRQRLFLQFKHDGRVRTAAFTEPARDRPAAPAATGEEAGHGH